MASALPAACLSEEQFTCSICLEVFRDPVSTPCGHSFCQACISSYWDRGGRSSKPYQCPLCKESFRKRPELHINRTLKEITEQFKQVADAGAPVNGGGGASEQPAHQLHPPPAPSSLPRQGDLPGSLIAEMRLRFQQLGPSGSAPPPVPQNPEQQDGPPPYPPTHPPPYSTPSRSGVNGGGGDPTLPLCPAHLSRLELFCRTDNTCVCSVCVETAEHRGHSVTPAKREWLIRKSQLGITELELKDLISERERKVEEIQSSFQEIKAAAERETDEAVCVFAQLISSVECCQAEVLEVIERNLRAAESRAQGLLKELEEEIAELRRRSATVNQLALSEDCMFFLQTFPSLSIPAPTKSWTGVSVSSQLTSGVVLRNVSQTIEKLQEEIHKLPEVCQRSSAEPSVPRHNMKVKRVQEYAADITLDPGTAHPRLVISEDGKQVQCGERHQLVPENPERFDRVVCVLAHQGFSSGRHYWEVEVGEKTDWDLGVASRSVNRKGKITVSPAHGYWFLSLRDHCDYAFRTEPSTSLSVSARPSRVGIFVDCDKGLVSFYNVEARVLIFSYTDSFSDTIHPFFSPCTNKSGRNEAPLIIRPVAVTE
ncbi:nuclear factor 7, brain-like isoform X2 [Salarias fasciatus]|uniref:Nuclear factor 7, brain-like n=1 Tax=Salarias fasciatus TaxID=181472 RepID=A0A672I792_SALFA|nr:nuclear factor 7, brain-like isoform X2 [Salarias fasciatus]